MDWKTHLRVTITVQLVVMFSLFFGAIAWLTEERGLPVAGGVGIAAGMIGTVLVRLVLFKFIIGARCVEPECAGRMRPFYRHDMDPGRQRIHYRCRACGGEVDTGLSEGA